MGCVLSKVKRSTRFEEREGGVNMKILNCVLFTELETEGTRDSVLIDVERSEVRMSGPQRARRIIVELWWTSAFRFHKARHS